ncbi:hypothetical protein LRP88_00150 [Fusarium phalaenopsidis]
MGNQASPQLLDKLPECVIINDICQMPPRDNRLPFLVLMPIFLFLATVFIVLRAVARFRLSGSWWWDDAVIALGYAASVGTTLLGFSITQAGGRDLWALEADGITRFFWLFWMAEWVYTISMAAIKISILLGFYRIFPSKAFRRLVILSIVFTAIWGAVFSIIYMVQCRPLGFFWHAWKGKDDGSCLSTSALIWSASLIAIITDFFMMAMPVFQLWPLQMEYKKKVLVAFMLCIGLL